MRRWENDERGSGVADAASFAPAVGRLVEAIHRDRWVAEEPELHLLPHLERACETLPFTLRASDVADDGVFVVDLEWSGASAGPGEVRAAAYALVGSFAEISTYVTQRVDDRVGVVAFDVVTGFAEGEGRFAPHGHTVSLRVSLPADQSSSS